MPDRRWASPGGPSSPATRWPTTRTWRNEVSSLDVEHPELGRSYKYPGAAAIFNGSPQRIYRRAPLVGEHNEEILCREIGVSRQELAILAEYGAV